MSKILIYIRLIKWNFDIYIFWMIIIKTETSFLNKCCFYKCHNFYRSWVLLRRLELILWISEREYRNIKIVSQIKTWALELGFLVLVFSYCFGVACPIKREINLGLIQGVRRRLFCFSTTEWLWVCLNVKWMGLLCCHNFSLIPRVPLALDLAVTNLHIHAISDSRPGLRELGCQLWRRTGRRIFMKLCDHGHGVDVRVPLFNCHAPCRFGIACRYDTASRVKTHDVQVPYIPSSYS